MTYNDGDQVRHYLRVRYLGPEPRGFLPLPDKRQRYGQPTGSPVHAYCPVGMDWQAIFADQEIPIALTEGEKKAIVACDAGIATIALGGVHNFRNKGLFLRELEAVAWNGRRVYILFDTEIPPKGDVDLATLRLAIELRRRGADVRIGKFPATEAKVGLDDFLAAGVDLQPILDNAEPPPLFASRASPSETATLIEELEYNIEGITTITHWRDEFFVWMGTHYERRTDTEIEARIRNILEMARTSVQGKDGRSAIRPFNPKDGDIREVKNALKHHALLPADIVTPIFRDAVSDDPAPRDLIPLRNGLLHLPTGKLLEHSARFFNLHVSNVDFDPIAPEPKVWGNALAQQFSNDEDQIAALQEWFGYCLSGDTSQQKILVEIGPTRSGKSLHVKVLSELLGTDSVAAVALTGFGKSFGLQNLIGKSLAVVTDAAESPHEMADDAVSRLKSISGEDPQSIERKYLLNWNGKLDARIWLIANHPLKFHDKSGALAARFIVIQTQKSFIGEEDPHLLEKLQPELPGILNWAIQGLQRLRARGRFVAPDSSLPMLALMTEHMAPVKRFLEECCDLGSDYSIAQSDLYQEWKRYCAETGYERFAGTLTSFVEALLAAYVGVTETRPHAPGKHGRALRRAFQGVRLKATQEAEQRARIAQKVGGVL